MAALPVDMVVRFIRSERLVKRVNDFHPAFVDPKLSLYLGENWVLPDEDVSHLLAEKYLLPAGCNVSYEMIWARWDMTAVKQNQPVMPDVEISTDEFDVEFLREIEMLSRRGPDWWRQVAAAAISRDGRVLATACNTHMPNEYETYIFGDPSVNRDAGEKGKSCVIHAEESVITLCAKQGLALDGARMYVTTFPCEGCAREIVASGVDTVYFSEGFSSLNAEEVFRVGKVKIVQVRDNLVSA
ncbi:MAG: deaminase [Minisyncoccia bacterium]